MNMQETITIKSTDVNNTTRRNNRDVSSGHRMVCCTNINN